MDTPKKNIFGLLRNKYVIASAIFLVWIFFFDEHSFIAHAQSRSRLSNLQKQQLYYKEKIESDQQKLKELKAGVVELEKYAREQYYMSKPNEDVFIVVDKE